jgi:hypothetical protein
MQTTLLLRVGKVVVTGTTTVKIGKMVMALMQRVEELSINPR